MAGVLALYDHVLYDEALYDEDVAFVQPDVPPDAAIFRLAFAAPPQTFERMLHEAVERGNQKRVE
jgi:hypothetical protein